MNQKKKVGNYLLTTKLGQGQFGVVYKGVLTNDPDKIFAIKSIEKSKLKGNSTLQRLFQTEMKVMSMIKHPNIMHLYEFMETQNNYYLVIDYCNNGDMEAHIKKLGKLSEEEAVYFLMQIMNGFQELHKNTIMHRDVKLANLFLNDDKVIIGDFGFAKAGVEVANTKLGTPITMAPELLNGNGGNYNSKADLWSIGVCFYQILFNTTPFEATSYKDLQDKVKLYSGDKLKFPNNVKISSQCKDLLIKLMQYDPKKRIEWKDFFNHPLFDLHSNGDNNHKKMPLNNSILVRNNENLVTKEFKRNRESIIPNEIHLRNPMEMKIEGNINKNNYEEESEDMSKYNELESKEIIQNNIKLIKDRYYHEKKKIIFIMYSVRKVRNMAKLKNIFGNLVNNFMLCSILMLKKGLHLNNVAIYSLKDKVNVFKLQNFSDFTATSDYNKILANLNEDNKIYELFYQQMIKKFEIEISDNNIKNKFVCLPDININGNYLGEYNELCSEQFFYILKSLKNINISSNVERELSNALINLYYSFNSEDRIKFIDDNNVQFKWTPFENGIENYTSLAYLMNNIKH